MSPNISFSYLTQHSFLILDPRSLCLSEARGLFSAASQNPSSLRSHSLVVANVSVPLMELENIHSYLELPLQRVKKGFKRFKNRPGL